MKEPTTEEMQDLVDFQRSLHGTLYVHTVKCSVAANIEGNVWGDVGGNVGGRVKGYVRDDVWGSVMGNVRGSVKGNVRGSVWGNINGRRWQFVETPKEQIIRLIREGRGEEAIKVLEESER